ncbi:MAG: hypothetical protein AAF915_02245 [Cyanobacteria bacterium P01_D01_bin.50]
MITSVKKIIKSIIPYQFHFYFQGKSRNYVNKDIRKDSIKFNIDDHVYLEVYWKIYGIGKGPALIVNALGEEVLKFDCYGPGKGHYHVIVTELQPNCRSILHLPEQTVELQIERAIFEIKNNLNWYLERHPLAKIRKLKIQKSQLQAVTEELHNQMIEYHEKVSQIQTVN